MQLLELVITYKTGHQQADRTTTHPLNGKSIIESEHYQLKLQIDNDKSWRIELLPKLPLQMITAYLTARIEPQSPDSVLTNGYQTWTESGEFLPTTRLPGLNPLTGLINKRRHLAAYGDYTFQKYAGKAGRFHSYSYACLRFPARQLLLGSLIEDYGFTIFEFELDSNRLTIRRDCPRDVGEDTLTLFDIVLTEGENQEQVFAAYFDAASMPLTHSSTTSGWTSWYNYYTGITEAIILENLEAFCDHDIPIDIFQIDDGYQQAVGDWLIANEKFPNGMAYIAEQIHDAGYDAGLWLAPFIAEAASNLVKHHPDWLLRNEKNEPVVAGHSNGWSGRFFALDFYHEEVRDYLQSVFATVLDTWDYDMLKLDFLYAAALNPPAGKSRGEVMREAMQFLRKLAGEKKLLGCGVPLASAFGLVDYCRVSADVGLKWEDIILSDMIRYRERVSTYAALRSTLARHALNQRGFANDPDVFILRDENVQMSEAQKRTLFIINLICGDLLFTSDNISRYSDETMHLYLSQFPLRPRKIFDIHDQDNLISIKFESHGRHYQIFANLGGKERTANIPAGTFFESGRKVNGSSLSIAPYETRILLQSSGENYDVIGSTLHIFPGMEIDEIEHLPNGLRIKNSPMVRNEGEVILRAPDNQQEVIVNGASYKCKQSDDIHFFRVSFK